MTTMWNQAAEAMSPDERAPLQTGRLRALVTRLLDSSSLYQERLGVAGVGISASAAVLVVTGGRRMRSRANHPSSASTSPAT